MAVLPSGAFLLRRKRRIPSGRPASAAWEPRTGGRGAFPGAAGFAGEDASPKVSWEASSPGLSGVSSDSAGSSGAVSGAGVLAWTLVRRKKRRPPLAEQGET